MTTDSDRDEIHATAEPDSAVDADPSLTDGEHPASGELSGSGERLGTEDDLSDSAEDEDDDAEDDDAEVDEDDEDDEVASAVVVTEVVSDPYGQEPADENEQNDEGGVKLEDSVNDEDSVGAGDVTADVADAADGYDGAAAASVDEAPPVPAPAYERTPTDAGLGDTDLSVDTGLAGDGEDIHQRWAAIQSSFVDDPHQSVADAAAFLEETTAALVASIQQRERELRGEWDNQSLDTEGLRTMLRRYRAVLDRISAL